MNGRWSTTIVELTILHSPREPDSENETVAQSLGARAQLDASTQLVRDAIAQIVEAGDAGEDGNEIPYESLLRIVQCEESTFTAAIFGRVLARLEDLNEAMLRGGVVHLI